MLPRWLEDAEEARELCRSGAGEAGVGRPFSLLETRPAWGSVLRMPLRSELQPRKEESWGVRRPAALQRALLVALLWQELFRRLASLPPSLLLFLKRLREAQSGEQRAECWERRAERCWDIGGLSWLGGLRGASGDVVFVC